MISFNNFFQVVYTQSNNYILIRTVGGGCLVWVDSNLPCHLFCQTFFDHQA